ncbi:MAG: glycosyltransferase [Nanoarchaeota archaeon]|nr:glycosyltransferase [Nanoarchaeota archaeon]
MNNSSKILVATPTYEGMRYCEKEFVESIISLEYSNYDILIVDNSENDDYSNHLKEIYPKLLIIRDQSNEKDKMLRLVQSRNLILDYAVKNNYDYILMMDSDVIPPKNIIQELLSCNKDIVSGLYYNYFVVDGKTKWLPVAWTEISEEEFENIKKMIDLPPFVKSRLDLRARITLEEAESNQLMKVFLPSAGCLLISKNVFSRIKYGLLDTSKLSPDINTTDDVYFMTKARELGFSIFCYTKIKCEHLIKGKYRKDSEGYYIHPIYD